ncbi:MAG: hypothetical protein LBL92_04570 [Propionibacteriaceae bacterium]|jgi:hypothetical protein|nr:hypothetical protein [Propionibacteriaceae bacterium]
MKRRARWRRRDLAAFLLGLLCLLITGGLVLAIVIGLTSALIPVIVPVILIALAVLALLGLRR